MKREKFIDKLQKAVDNIKYLYLPAEITKIYAYGSISREKLEPNDLDLGVLYDLTPEQVIRWKKFEHNFSNDNENEQAINSIGKSLARYRASGEPFHKAVKIKEVSNILRKHEIEPVWAGCFSWGEVFDYNPYGFRPLIRTVLHRMLFGKTKRLQVEYREGQSLQDVDLSIMTAKNYCLAWSKERPDVLENLDGRDISEKLAHNIKVLDRFLDMEIPRYQKEFFELMEKVTEKLNTKGITLKLNALLEGHKKVNRTGNESLTELSQKCEQARFEMKRYKNENSFLRILSYYEDKIDGYTIDESLAHRVIQFSKRRGVPKSEVRAIMRIVGLPEERIVPIKKPGFRTSYKLAKSEEERNRLLIEAENENKLIKLHKAISRAVKKYEPRARIDFQKNAKGALIELTVSVFTYTEQLSHDDIEFIENQLRQKGFEVRKGSYYLEGLKCIALQGSETEKEMVAISKKLMGH